MAKYFIGDRVKIVSQWNDKTNQNNEGKMDKWLGTTMTISDIYDDERGFYKLKEDTGERWDGVGWTWNEACFAGYADNPFEAYWVRRSDREDTIGICWGHDRADLLIQWVCGEPKYIHDIGEGHGHNGNARTTIKDKCFNYTDQASEWVPPQYVTRIDEWEIIDKPDKASFIRLNSAGGFSFNKPNSILYFDKTVDQTEKTASGENLLITAKHHYTLTQFTLDEPVFDSGWRYISTDYQWVRPRGCGAHAEGKKSEPKAKTPDPKTADAECFKPYWGYVKDYSGIKQDKIVYVYAEGGAWYEPPKTREFLVYLPIDSGHNGNDFIKIKPSEDVKIPERKSWWFNQDKIIPIEFAVSPHRSPKVGDFIRILTPKYGQKGKILRVDECCGGNLVKVKAENHFDRTILGDKLYAIGDSCELLDITAPVEIRTMVEIPKAEGVGLEKLTDWVDKQVREYCDIPESLIIKMDKTPFNEKCNSTVEELKKSAAAPESDETITSPYQIIQAIIIYGPNAGTIISTDWKTCQANPNYYKPLL